MLVSHEVIEHSNIAFGTSGARGLVTDFTPDVCAAFTVSFIETMRFSFTFDTIAFAIDNRPSSKAMAQACTVAAQQLGLQVIYYGVIPTPALANQAMSLSIPSIMVTGSHIPFDRNGLKFYRPDGEISKSDESSIINGQFTFEPLDTLVDLVEDKIAATAYITRYSNLFDTQWLKGKRVGIYQHSSAGRDIYPALFEQLGAEVVLIGRSDTFVPIDTEAVSEADSQKAIEWTEQYQLDALFSTDGDGDRPMLADEHGHWLRGDILCLLCAQALKIDALAIPVSCNTAVELSDSFNFVMRTKIGSPYVIAAFSSLHGIYDSYAGFEANGGFLLGSDISINQQVLTALPTRDAILPVLMALYMSQHSSVSALTANLPMRFTHSDRLTEFAISKSQQIIDYGNKYPNKLLALLGLGDDTLQHFNSVDGLRFTLTSGDVVHLRPSGNAPEFRCYTESHTHEKARELVNHVLPLLADIHVS
ncbi:phosphomannomutase [Shewanella frigidimarina]|uniref:phosphomannomutase n=1 Tax=Shewanella frigidimarina TaxID=56812 RepID=UPI00317E4E11